MSITAPHYLLFSETQSDQSNQAGGWSFVLKRMDSPGRIEVADQEPDVRGERLKLLAVIRGLEALERPASVTLITPSRFIGRALRSGISTWKDNNWQWERFGAMTEIKNADLWKRLDRARQIHTIDCRVWNFGKLLRMAAPSFDEPATARQPVIKSYKDRAKNRRLQIPSWTEFAASMANQIINPSTQQAYGCA